MVAHRVYVVYSAYGPRYVSDGLSRLREFCETVLPGYEQRVVVVQNASADEVEIMLAPELHEISGDNSAREFSAYDRGVWWLRRFYGELDDSAVFVIANDSYYRSYGGEYLNGFTRVEVQTALDRGELIGWTDSYPRPVQLFGLSVQCWIRTSLFLCRAAELMRLLPMTAPFGDAEIFSGEASTFFRLPSQLSDNYRQYLKTWLFGEADPSGEFREAWHSQARLTSENLRMFERKAKAILCEHYLSARAQVLGIGVFDIRREVRADQAGVWRRV